MKIFAKINDEWFITECSEVKYEKSEGAVQIEITKAQFEKLQNQYDTEVKNGEIVQQTKWDNALRIEEESERLARIEKEQQTPAE